MKQGEDFGDKGLRIFRKFKGSILLMHLRNIQEYGYQELCVIDNYSLQECIFLVFAGFF